MDETCHTKPIPDQICVCPTDQMICDHSKGCLCKEGGDCGGGQRLLDLTKAIPLQEENENSNHGATVAIVLSVLSLGMISHKKSLITIFGHKCNHEIKNFIKKFKGKFFL